VALFLSTSAFAREGKVTYNIPSQDLVAALNTFSLQSGEQIVFDGAAVRGKKSHALLASVDKSEALQRLLDGTGLAAVELAPGVQRVYPLPAKAKVDTPAGRHDDPSDNAPTTTIYVVGTRQALQSAGQQKRVAADVRDVIVAEDISRLPDSNLAEGMQRLSGVQITRDMGEGDQIAVRGLTQVAVLLNGRQLFSDTRRTFELGSVPTDGFSQLGLLKTTTAPTIEGGVGGVVNLKTWSPFDFAGRIANVTLRQTQYDLSDTKRWQGNLLGSTRFNGLGGELGLLVTAASSDSAGRLDSIGIEPFISRDDLGVTASDGGPVLAPHGAGNSVNYVDRSRQSIGVVAEWRRGGKSLKWESYRFAYRSSGDAVVVYANDGPMTPAPGASFTLAPNSDVVNSGAYGNIIVTVPNNYFDTWERLNQDALSGKWRLGADSWVSFDISQTDTNRHTVYGGLRIGTSNAYPNNLLTFDLAGDLPALRLTGSSLLAPTSYVVQDSSSWRFRAESSLHAGQVDMHWAIASNPLVRSLDVGGRATEQSVSSGEGGWSHLSQQVAATTIAGAATPVAISSFFDDRVGQQLLNAGVLGAPRSLVRDVSAICTALGDTVCEPPWDPADAYSGDERTYAVYAQLNYALPFDRIQIDGNFGLRYVNNHLTIAGFESGAGGLVPIESRTRYSYLLPSFNLRADLSRGFQLRLANSATLTRPDFENLAPNLNISYTGPNSSPVGSAGNPALRPITATSWDLSLEHYRAGGSYEFISLFSKRVMGFYEKVVAPEIVHLPNFEGYGPLPVSRIRNGGTGHVSGVEAGLQTLFPALPVIGSGLGVQANFTYVLSDAPSPVAGDALPLLGLSKESGNLILYYDAHPWSARIAYSYRGGFLETTSGVGSGFSALYDRPFGVLDASVGWEIGGGAQLRFAFNNVLRPVMSTYFSGADQPRFYSVYDRRVSVTLRLRR
jgi:TonB-dependent receptor